MKLTHACYLLACECGHAIPESGRLNTLILGPRRLGTYMHRSSKPASVDTGRMSASLAEVLLKSISVLLRPQ
jgi:hypothetical protein